LKQSKALSDLIQMSENELQGRIVEPLLRAMGFTEVRDNSGPNEKGKDLIATKKSEFGRSLLWGIQLKKLRVDARVTSSDSLGALIIQLKQAKEEKVVDPSTNERRSPDNCVFITPYPIAPHVWERFHEAARDLMKQNIEVVDGPRILDLIDRHAPDLLQEFSMDVQYRRRLARELNQVPAARAALGLPEDLELDNIYVDTSIRASDDILLDLAQYPLLKEGRKTFLAKPNFLTALKDETSKWDAEPTVFDPPIAESRDEKDRVGALTENAKTHPGKKVFQINLDPVLAVIQQQVRDTLSDLATLSSEPSSDRLTEILRRVVLTKRQVVRFLDLVTEYWPLIVDRESKIEWDCSLTGLQTKSVLNTDINLHVLGAAGSGKTTLLRRFCQLIAREYPDVIPIYLPLVTLTNPTATGILEACTKQLISYGYRSNINAEAKRQLRELCEGLRSGMFRLFLDGLDETGSTAGKLIAAVDEIAERFPKCRIVISSRYGFAGNRLQGAAELRLAPFNNAQLEQFLRQWFRSEPSSLREISLWLKHNRGMRNAARNPLIAALLCSLFDMAAAMPNTEIDLYEQRFDLLLGRWERAKGITPLRPDLRRRYWRFITELAFDAHSREYRVISFANAVDFAETYYEPNYHGDSGKLVMDCIHRGILEFEPNGYITFGHFTYQEFLVARRLAMDNDLAFILAKLDSDWWMTVLRFYVTIKEDITPLVRHALSQGSMTIMKYQRLQALAKNAPWTNADAIAELSVIVELGTDPEKSSNSANASRRRK
jgi:NACHT domain/Restriction endonuclease